jgi:hypothetical protein
MVVPPGDLYVAVPLEAWPVALLRIPEILALLVVPSVGDLLDVVKLP